MDSVVGPEQLFHQRHEVTRFGQSGDVDRIRTSRCAALGLSTEEDIEEMVSGLRNASLDAVNCGETVVLE